MDITVGSVWQGKNNEGDVLIVWANQNRVHYDYLNSLGNPMGDVYDTSIKHFLDYFEPKTDMVNHPPHYKDASGVECCEVTDLMMFNAASCFKYLYRCGNKWDDIEDLKKAVWYAKRAYLTGDNEQPNSLEWDNNVKAIASYREHGIYKAMTAIRSYSWLAAAAFIGNEIERLESE